MFRYVAHGMTFDSEIELPELAPADGSTPEERRVVVRVGPVDETLENPAVVGGWYRASPGRYLLRVPGIAAYYATDGERVTVAPHPEASDDDVRTFLIASVFGAIAHQRGLLPLHATAVRVGDGCVLFAGPSGVGKSTLAAAFMRHGHSLVADDLCVTSAARDGVPVAHPGYRRIKLWRDAIEHLDAANGASSGADAAPRRVRRMLDKFSLAASDAPSFEPLPIRRMYLLRIGPPDAMLLTPLRGAVKLHVLRRQTYRRRLAGGCGAPQQHFLLSQGFAARVPILTFERPRDLNRLDDAVTRILDDVGAEPPA